MCQLHEIKEIYKNKQKLQIGKKLPEEYKKEKSKKRMIIGWIIICKT